MIGLKVRLLISGTQPTSTTGVLWPGGLGVFTATSSNWNGGTVNLQYIGPDGSTLVTAGTNTTLTANGNGVFYLGACQLVATITGSPVGVFADADRVAE